VVLNNMYGGRRLKKKPHPQYNAKQSYSLLLLVSALIGRRRLLDLYEQAKAEGYRFFSYGDAMWIPPEAVLESAAPMKPLA
jgi:hypothetical protein